MAAFASLNTQSRSVRAFIERLSRSRFFTISVALHFIFVLGFGGIVLVKQAAPRADFDDTSGGLVAPAPPAPAEAIQPMDAPTVATTAAPSTATPLNTLSVIMTATNTSSAFTLPATPLTAPTTGTVLNHESATAMSTTPSFSGIPSAKATAMKKFTGGWAAPGDSGSGVGHDRAFKFTAYLAKYEGGDWDSTIQMNDGKIAKGSLPNLLYLMRKWSQNKIDAQPDAIPLDLSSDKIFTIHPPFIFFTGHRDFKLTDKEVENLTKYLQLGGAIWGDSSLPGSRSRFDVAFRREMKRVLPDQNIVWETLPPTHPIFTETYYPEIKTVPGGVNYYQEPVYALKLYGEISVLYTANDYGDMWQMGLTAKGQIDYSRDAGGGFIVLNDTFLQYGDIYFRNMDVKSLNDSYKFGTNIILHLLTRWEEKLRNVPTGL
jgi:hypothetical protein